MALTVKYTDQIIPRPRALIYGDSGDGKTALAATAGPDTLFAATLGGLQTVANLHLPYVELFRSGDWNELIAFFKNGKIERDPGREGYIRVGNNSYNGVCADVFSEFVTLTLQDLVATAKSVVEGKRAADQTSEFEYKTLNFRTVKQITDLCALPLRHVIFTAYAQEQKDKEGTVLKSFPRFEGQQIWKAVAGNCDYVWRIRPALSIKDQHRLIATQPTGVHYAKTRVPGVVGKVGLPPEVKYPLGHPTMLRDMFAQVEQTITGQRQLTPIGPTPTGVEDAA